MSGNGKSGKSMELEKQLKKTLEKWVTLVILDLSKIFGMVLQIGRSLEEVLEMEISLWKKAKLGRSL